MTRSLAAIAALLGAGGTSFAAPVLFPNGDFESPGGDQWGQAAEGDQDFGFPSTGGNGGGFAEITSGGDEGFAVLISNGDQPLPLASLGLNAGETYRFFFDMRSSAAGPDRGGVKVESWSADAPIADSGDRRVESLSTGWESYSIEYTIDADATHLKIVPLWTPGETVGFDNIGVDNTPLAPPPFVPDRIENGDFETPDGAGWGTTEGTPTFPTSGGNPGGNAVLDGTAPEFTVLYAFDNTEKTFASLGLAPGDTYVFQMDMRLESGTVFAGDEIGGLRLQGPEGFVEEYYPDVVGDGSEWASYSIELTVPPTPEQVKFGLRARPTAVVAFDNVSIVVPSQLPFSAEITPGTVVGWSPTSATNTYQPQRSPDGASWTDLGPLIVGDSVDSLFDADGPAQYRVQEFRVSEFELVVDGGFEDGGSWLLDNGNVFAEEILDAGKARSGSWYVYLAVDSGASTEPRKALVQQSTGPGTVFEGDVLDLSLWAFVESNDGAVFLYSVKWRAEDGAVIGQVDGSMTGFPTGEWTQATESGLVAPANTDSAFVEIEAVTGAIAEQSGAIRIDDISLVGAVSSPLQTLPATTGSGVQISWPTEVGRVYQPESSVTLESFSSLGSELVGDGTVQTIFELVAPPAKYFRVTERPAAGE